MVAGGCRIYEIGEPMHEKPAKQYSQVETMYAERPRAKGFGCSRCEYGAEAKGKDPDGRESWCEEWGMHVRPKACCDQEDGPDLVEAPSETKPLGKKEASSLSDREILDWPAEERP
jgi:hypothetical protein